MRTLLDIVDASATRFADKPALLIKPAFRTRTWTYRDVAEAVPRIARVLRESGIAPGDRVVIWAVNRPEWGLAFLGALHAGAVLVPLDVRSTPDFSDRVVARTRPVAVLASHQTLERARALGLPLHTIESLPDLARGCPPLPRAEAGPDDLVEVVFTSGTTGDPKGAMLTHANLVADAEAAVKVFPLGPQQRELSVLPLSHMFEQTGGLIAPLLAGASIAYPSSLQPSVLIRSFRQFRASMLLIVPQGLRLLNNAIERRVDQGGQRRAFERLHAIARRLPMSLRRVLFLPVHTQFGGRLRYVAVGGAALDPELGARWMEMGVNVLQGYGATETSPIVSFTPPDRNNLGTVGPPIPGVAVRVADDGELLVRGPNVFQGYWENEDATRAVLDSEGWYHTGDLGQLDADGNLVLRGRKKDMIVLPDGTKVHPEDIEEILARDTRVKDSAVVGLERPGEDIQVHAVLLLNDAKDADAVVRDTNTKLSSSQQIRGWTVWPDEDFPRTHTLKVKKRVVLERLAQLRAATQETAAAAPTRTTPLSDVARLVAQVAQVPGDAVKTDSRLSSDLGLDSLGRVELLGVIEEELGAYIDDASLDPETTVGALETLVASARETKRDDSIYAWPLSPLVRFIGVMLQELLISPLMHIFYKIKVTGRENLRGLRGPVMFTPNHCLHWDNGIILSSIPLGWRWKLSVAAAADDIFGNPLRGLAATVLANAFPLAREGAIRRSLELLGARLDRNFSVLIYPEGKLTVAGPLQPFKSGTGLIAVEGGTPVVPMKLKINKMSILDGIDLKHFAPNVPVQWAPRGDVEVVFGKPIVFGAETDFNAATEQIQASVAAL
jgi:long-chain acyl-CoA synthetase